MAAITGIPRGSGNSDAHWLCVRCRVKGLLRDHACGPLRTLHSWSGDCKPRGDPSHVWYPTCCPGENREWADELAEGLDERLAADYDIYVQYTADAACQECSRARKFCERIRTYLVEKGVTDQELRGRAENG